MSDPDASVPEAGKRYYAWAKRLTPQPRRRHPDSSWPDVACACPGHGKALGECRPQAGEARRRGSVNTHRTGATIDDLLVRSMS